MSCRAALLDERFSARARVGTLAESADNTGSALTTVVWLAGIGFAIYATLNWIMPALLSSATKTRSAYRGLKEAGPATASSSGARAYTSTPSAPTYQYCSANPAAAECIGLM